MVRKQTLYTSARATISCAVFKAGDIVAVRFSHRLNGVDWYDILGFSVQVCYPAHHLTNFVI